MDIIKEIQDRLARYPAVSYQAAKDHITVQPQGPDGFEVSLNISRSGLTVGFEGWHETFSEPEEALDCFALGLSEACRLKIEYRGRMATKWELQTQEDGDWVTDSEVDIIFIPFWRPKRVVYRQNHLVLIDNNPYSPL